MNHLEFKIGFWHPFGPHGCETAEQIIERKRREIEANGWTLWSFQHRTAKSFDDWFQQLKQVSEPLVFCSKSDGAVDPSRVGTYLDPVECRYYKCPGYAEWQSFPPEVKVIHPFKGRHKQASAFKIKQIIHPAPVTPQNVEWFSKGAWRSERIPTHGEYLIRPGGSNLMRPVSAILVLEPPYLATVSADHAD